jgi:hypothetical protein
MTATFSRLPAVLAVLLLLAACGLTALPGQELEAAIRHYSQQLRWQDYPGVATYLAEEHRDDFLQRYASLEDLRIVDVRLESAGYREGERRGTSTIVIEYYQLPSLSVRKFRLHQQWAYQGGDRYHPGSWRIVSPFPDLP